jgi:hypothetical protein
MVYYPQIQKISHIENQIFLTQKEQKMFKKLFTRIKIWRIKKFGGVLWIRFNGAQIFIKTFGQVTSKSASLEVSPFMAIMGPECDPRNGYHGYVLAEGWEELSDHLQDGLSDINIALVAQLDQLYKTGMSNMRNALEELGTLPNIHFYKWFEIYYVSPDSPPQNFELVTVERIDDHPDNQGVGEMPGSCPVTLNEVMFHHTHQQVETAINRLLESLDQ